MPLSRLRRGSRAQSLVEFTLVAPLLFLVMFLTIDFARLVYVYGAISSATREGARVLTLKSQLQSDCLALQTAGSVAQGFSLSQDPGSLYGNGNPNNPAGATYAPSTPPSGQGYIYIWPAVATPAGCDNATRTRPYPASAPGPGGQPPLKEVSMQIQYRYVPMLSFFTTFVPPLTIKAISVVNTEY